MAKNIIVCCDGTSNQPAQDMTNVAKLYFTLVNDPGRQITFYHPGVGTMEPPGALTWWQRLWTVQFGLAMGRGIQDDIRDAYVFLCNRFEDGDRIFLFGFSRGAYTARALTGLLKMYGLIQPGNDPLVPYAIRMLFAINRAEMRNDDTTAKTVFTLAKRFRGAYSRACAPYFVGLWDTVSSVGWFAHPTRIPYTANDPDIAIGRHAVAIDERRAFFPSNLWRPSTSGPAGPKDLKQVWFPGSHSDVGGGYPEGPESAQSKYALEWVIEEARKAGLLLDRDRVDEIMGRAPGSPYEAAGTARPIHNSLTGWWRLLEFIPKPRYVYTTGKTMWWPNFFAPRNIPQGALVHQSAYLRGDKYLNTIKLPIDAVVIPHEPCEPVS